MKKLIAILTVILAMSVCAKAQTRDMFYPQWKMSALGGVNYVYSDAWAIRRLRRLTPNFQIGLEYDFLPWMGFRVSGSGPMGLYPSNPYYQNQTSAEITYVQIGTDAMFDIRNMFEYQSARVLNPYMFAGLAGVDRFKTASAKNWIGVGFRTGLGLSIRLGNVMRILFESQYNALGNRFNTLDDNEILGDVWDDNFAALAGLQFTLGARRRKAEEAAHAERVAEAQAAAAAAAQATAERIAAARAADEAYFARLATERAAAEAAAAEAPEEPTPPAPPANPREASETILFDFYEFEVPASQTSKLDRIIAVLNEFPDTIVTLSGYADKDTEPQMPDRQMAKLRLDSVKNVLTDAGIDDNRILVNNYGSSQQVSDTAGQNSVVVCETE